VGPKRRIAAADNHVPAERDSVSEVDSVPRGYDGSRHQLQHRLRIGRAIVIRYRVEDIHPNHIAVVAETHVIATTDDVQATQSNVAPSLEMGDPRNQVEMSNLRSGTELDASCIYQADSKANTWADDVAK
jgi:hypothetical protein